MARTKIHGSQIKEKTIENNILASNSIEDSHIVSINANKIIEVEDRKFITNDEKNKISKLKEVISGTSNFASSYNYVEITFEDLGNTNYTVAITPIGSTEGKLGDFWVVKGTNNIKVYNTGEHEGEFDYYISF